MASILIKNGLLVDPANQLNQLADIRLDNGRIDTVAAANSLDNADRIIDASGLVVCPGLVDCCARLREPGAEHKATIASETRAASHAGITTLCCPPDTDPVIDEPAVVELIHQKAATSAHSRVVTLGALTAGLKGEHLSEMSALKEAGCVGVSNARQPVENTQILKRAFAYAATFGLRVFIEPSDYWLSLDGCAHEGKIASRLGLKGIPKSAETVAIASA
ncbi:MAG TPA: dihydroorotase, partial [Thiotrichales bacterium]|nr:dihydroorotase [Thiotrichales bacterium]